MSTTTAPRRFYLRGRQVPVLPETVPMLGYCAVWGEEYEVDGMREVVEPRALDAFLAAGNTAVPLLWMHEDRTYLGKAHLTADDFGLLVESRLRLDSDIVSRLVRTYLAGGMSGMSWGILSPKCEYLVTKRSITRAEVAEVSCCWQGANPAAHSILPDCPFYPAVTSWRANKTRDRLLDIWAARQRK